MAKLNDCLGNITPEEKKLLYDTEVAEDIYNEYCCAQIDDEGNYKKFY